MALRSNSKRQKLDEYRRATLRPFARLGSWSRRNDATTNENEPKPSKHSHRRHRPSDTRPTYIVDTEDEDEVSEDSAEYSDAQSTLEQPMRNDTQVASISIDSLAIPRANITPQHEVNQASDPDASPDLNPTYVHGDPGSLKRSPYFPSRLLNEADGTSQPPSKPAKPLRLQNAQRKDQQKSCPTLTSSWSFSRLDRAAEDALELPSPKPNDDEETKVRPGWSIDFDPWADLDEQKVDAASRKALEDENARLREELQQLKGLAPKQGESSATEVRTPAQEQTNTPPASPPRSRKRAASKPAPQQDTALFETTTLRDLVLKRLFAPQVTASKSTSVVANDQATAVTLDTPLTAIQTQEFSRIMNEVIVEGRHLKQPIALCAVCHLPKFKEAKGMNQHSYISEVLTQFPSLPVTFEDFHPVWGLSSCCRRYVCKACLRNAIISGIATQWAHDLSSKDTTWIKCPVPCCRHALPLKYNCDFMGILQELGVDEPLVYVRQYENACQLRKLVQALDPLPSREEMRQCMALHNRLARYGKMWPLLEGQPADGSAEPPEVEPKLERLPVDTPDGQGTMKIPVFTHLLRPRVPKDCMVCAETYEEFDLGDASKWAKAITGFAGEWTWRILAFPAAEILPDCRHDLDICRSCLATHISTQLEMQGHSVVGNVKCPTPDCKRSLEHTEIRILATAETFSKYDRFAVIKSVSNLPNFRWCLGQGCTSGSLYDDPSTQQQPSKSLSKSSASSPSSSSRNDPNRIMCSDCQFNMCLACQVPWHHNLTCAQYGSLRKHGDPHYARTQSWISRNTKPCPGDGCGVAVQKGEGCFHMSCPQCRFEFCWECQADWRSILDAGAGVLRAEGHREGCYFRTHAMVMPTQVNGSTLERGLRRYEQQQQQQQMFLG